MQISAAYFRELTAADRAVFEIRGLVDAVAPFSYDPAPGDAPTPASHRVLKRIRQVLDEWHEAREATFGQ